MTAPLPAPPHPLDELARAPEMAIIRILDGTLHVLRLTLVVQHPTLFLDDATTDRPHAPTLRRAATLIRRVDALRLAMRNYTLALHDAIRPTPFPPDDIF